MSKEDRSQLRAVKHRAKELAKAGLAPAEAMRKAVDEEIADAEKALDAVHEQARAEPPARDPKRRLKR